MGVSESKTSQIDEDSVYDFSGISYDEFGNLVYEKVLSNRKDEKAKENELREIIACEDKQVENIDNTTAKVPQEWYIMDALWVELWLAHIYVDKDQPAPGPCNNYRLIHANFDENKWEGRSDMKISRGEKGGDYRRVNKKTWDAYKKYYPGSGPEIKITEVINSDGSVDMNHLNNALNWVVENIKLPKHRSKKVSAQVQRIDETIAAPVTPVKSSEETVVNPVKSPTRTVRIEEPNTGAASPLRAMNVIKAVTKLSSANKSMPPPPVIPPAAPVVSIATDGGDSDDEVPRQAPKIVIENRAADSDDD